MASFLLKVKHNVPHAIERRGLGGYAIDKVERYGAAAGFGFIKGYYREKAAIKGAPVDVLVGGLAVGAAALLEIFGGGRSQLAPHLNAVGDAGLMSYIGSMACAAGTKKSGRQVYISQGAVKGALPAGLTAVGALPQADGLGAYLSEAQIAKFSSQR